MQREQERAEAAKTAKMQMKREQEAEERRRQRASEASKPPAVAAAAPPPPSNSGEVWRRGPARQEATPTGSPRTAGGSLPQASPARYIPPSQRAAAGGDAAPAPGRWREQARLREQGPNGSGSGRNSPVPGSPALGRNSPAPRTDDDGFQTVGGKPKPSPGAYRPPGARGPNR
jgi:translation initiation factor 3 subunit A